MGLNDTPASERLHIGFFGLRNVGKSSLVNAVTGQELSLVSEVKGTTTDPVQKAMELLPLGPVVIIDTPGMDDTGALGEQRVRKAREILARTDIAVLVADAQQGLRHMEQELCTLFRERDLPYLIAYNKADLCPPETRNQEIGEQGLYVSAVTGENVYALKEKLGAFARGMGNPRRLVADLLSPGDMAVLVVPIDESAPKGRLILPQQQTMRDILDAHGVFAVCQDRELRQTLSSLSTRPRLVITDSQAFQAVARDTPEDVWLTSFSILFARYKGNLEELVRGAAKLSILKNGDRVLISEGCTHHRQCNDIGTVKLPGWIGAYSGAELEYTYSSGGTFPEDLANYALVVHCGGCMLHEKEMQRRIAQAKAAGVPIVNYGIAIAQMHGILRRSLEPFPEMLRLLDH